MTITTQRMVLFVGSCYNENVEGTGSRIGYYKRVDRWDTQKKLIVNETIKEIVLIRLAQR